MPERDDHRSAGRPDGQEGNSSRPRAGRLVLRLASIEDLLAWLPYGIGFHPARSICVVGFELARHDGPMVVRMDLPATADEAPAYAEYIAGRLQALGTGTAVLVGYGSDVQVTPMIEALETALAQAGVSVHEAVRVDEGRYFSYLGTRRGSCPPEGTAFDSASNAIAAAAVAAGRAALPDRESLTAIIAPTGGQQRKAMAAATNARWTASVTWAAPAAPANPQPNRTPTGSARSATRSTPTGAVSNSVTTTLHGYRCCSAPSASATRRWRASIRTTRSRTWRCGRI